MSCNDIMKILVAISFTFLGGYNFFQGNFELGAIEFAIVSMNIHCLGDE